jgi:hypothetical protein
VFLREGYAGYVIPCRVLVVVLITSFLPLKRGLEFLLFDGGVGILLLLQCSAVGLCSLWRAGLLASAEWQVATQWRSWDSSSWTREM